MKAVVAAFNQEKALVGAFSVITNLRMQFFEALVGTGAKHSALREDLDATCYDLHNNNIVHWLCFKVDSIDKQCSFA